MFGSFKVIFSSSWYVVKAFAPMSYIVANNVSSIRSRSDTLHRGRIDSCDWIASKDLVDNLEFSKHEKKQTSR